MHGGWCALGEGEGETLRHWGENEGVWLMFIIYIFTVGKNDQSHIHSHSYLQPLNIEHFYSNRLVISACSVAPDDAYSWTETLEVCVSNHWGCVARQTHSTFTPFQHPPTPVCSFLTTNAQLWKTNAPTSPCLHIVTDNYHQHCRLRACNNWGPLVSMGGNVFTKHMV